MTKCPYRVDKDCIFPTETKVDECNRCLLGQIADNTDLLITAIGNLTASIEESLCRQTVDRYEELAKKYPKASIEERLCGEKTVSDSHLVVCIPREHDEHCNECKHAKSHAFVFGQCDDVCYFSGKECRGEQK